MTQHRRHIAAANGGHRPHNSIERQIHAFLAGDSDGGDLLDALYSHVLDEPIPARLRALLKH